MRMVPPVSQRSGAAVGLAAVSGAAPVGERITPEGGTRRATVPGGRQITAGRPLNGQPWQSLLLGWKVPQKKGRGAIRAHITARKPTFYFKNMEQYHECLLPQNANINNNNIHFIRSL